jgi:hypothetical protein
MHLGKKPGTHGGRPLVNGIRSSLPQRLRERADAAAADERLTDLRELIAVLSALVQTVASRIEEGDTPEFRRRALELVDDMVSKKGQPDGEAGKALHALITHIRTGHSDVLAEALLWDRIERMGKRVEELKKIELSAKNAISIDEQTKQWVRVLSILERLIPAELFPTVRDGLAREVLPPATSLN